MTDRAKPFAIVEQRELLRLRQLGAKPRDIAALLCLRVRQNPNGEVRDGIASLARWACMSPASMRRALEWLESKHVVTALERERAEDLGQGVAWRWPRRVSPFEFWAQNPRPEAEALPLWRAEGRAPEYEEIVRFKAAGGRL